MSKNGGPIIDKNRRSVVQKLKRTKRTARVVDLGEGRDPAEGQGEGKSLSGRGERDYEQRIPLNHLSPEAWWDFSPSLSFFLSLSLSLSLSFYI